MDLTGKALSSASSKTIPITKAENVVITLNDSQPNYLSGSAQHPHDGNAKLILGDNQSNNIYDNATGSVLSGGLGNDYIETSTGVNWLFGDSGNDILAPGDFGQKYIYGGDGGDLLSVKLNTNFNAFDLSTGSFDGQWNGNWNNEYGSNEQFIKFNEIEHLSISGGGSGIVRGDQNNNYINTNFEAYGGSGDDYLTTSNNVNIYGEDGNDILEFRGGYGGAHFDGGAGVDTLKINNSVLNIELNDQNSGTITYSFGSGTASKSFSNIEQFDIGNNSESIFFKFILYIS